MVSDIPAGDGKMAHLFYSDVQYKQCYSSYRQTTHTYNILHTWSGGVGGGVRVRGGKTEQEDCIRLGSGFFDMPAHNMHVHDYIGKLCGDIT